MPAPSVFRFSPHAGACDGGPDMCAGAYAMTACTRLCSDRADMRSSIDAAIANAGTTARNRADMGASANTMGTDMCAYAHAQHIDAAAYILGAGRAGAHNKAKNKGGNDFHEVLRHRAWVPEGNQPRRHWVPDKGDGRSSGAVYGAAIEPGER